MDEHKMKIDHQFDHADGSATYRIDMNDEEATALLQEGMLSLLRKGIAEVAAYQNEVQSDLKEVWPDAWLVGEHVFKRLEAAQRFSEKYQHYGIIPLYRG
jgi:hypothetical protein